MSHDDFTSKLWHLSTADFPCGHLIHVVHLIRYLHEETPWWALARATLQDEFEGRVLTH